MPMMLKSMIKMTSLGLFFVPALAMAQDGNSSQATTSTKTDNRPTISQEEYEPVPPPTAEQIESAKSPEQVQSLAEKELNNFANEAQSFGEDIKDVIKVRYNQKREEIESQFDVQIGDLEGKERDRRKEAIERFETFLAKYSNDQNYTPDAMFRLAELYFERASDDYLTNTEKYEDVLAAYDRGEIAAEPEPPAPDYSDTITIYEKLIGRFPTYRHADAARYLLGYSYGEEGEDEKSLAMYQSLVDSHPTSKFLPEVLTRIGEIYFDQNTREALEGAVDIYTKVLKFTDSPYYDKALYKLAWTHYRLDMFDESVRRFVELVDYADEQKRLTGKTGSELRAEALQYIAISLADEKWGGMERAETVLGQLDDRPYVGEMWKRFGEILFDQTRFKLAIDVMRKTRDKYPDASYNPEIQAKIITAFERVRDFSGATQAREALVAKYDEGSDWYTANRDDKPALERARELTERSLYRAAIYNHQQAQAYKQNNQTVRARDSYSRAANGYQTYLNRFPDSKNSYDFNFYLAECLYYGDDFQKAAEQYALVRDSNADNRHLEAAALSAVISYEKFIEKLEKSGQLTKEKFLTAAERNGAPIKPKDIAEIRLQLVAASDRFMTILPKSDRAPAVAYRVAEIYYNHEQLEEARGRFLSITEKFPGTEVARYSANLIIESYLANNDWDKVREWSQKLIDINGDKEVLAKAEDKQAQEKLVDDLRRFKVGAVFKKAEQLNEAGDFENAANLYVQLVDETPDHEFADKALFNAAIAFEKVKRFDAASNVYQRIVDSYPKSELANRSLFRVGVNFEKGFEFAGAIKAYMTLVDRYPKSEHRADALFNAAVTLEKLQQYDQAAVTFKRYATTFPSREDAGAMFFRSAIVYEKMKAWPEMIGILGEFIKKYSRNSAQKQRIVEAYQKIGDANLERGKTKLAVKAFKSCVSEYDKRRLRSKDRAATYAAHCAFEIAEDKFREYDGIRLVGTGKKQVKSLKRKAQLQRTVEKAYKEVYKYKRVETTLASLYRIGYTYERFAEAMFSAEIPPEFKNNEELANEYKLQLENQASVLERKAESAYRRAYKEARKTKVTNQWSQKTLEGLNKYKPDEFPVQKAGKAALQRFTISGHGLDTLEGEPRDNKPESSSTGGAQ